MRFGFGAVLRFLTLFLIPLWFLGCQRSDSISIEYGKSGTRAGIKSVNGTSLLADIFRQRGKTVRRGVSISPVLRRYDVVVWFPDTTNAPTQKEVDALEKWLTETSGRTLVYVGRFYDAELDFWNQIESQIDTEKREEYLRKLAEARVGKIRESVGSRFFSPFTFWDSNKIDDCDWFSIKPIAQTTFNQLTGPLANSIDAGKVNIPLTSQLVIDDPINQRVDVLLSADEIPLVSSIEFDAGRYPFSSSQIVMVNDGSFLLNFGLVNPEHRKLAGRLIDQIGDFSNVLFLESGPGPCPVRERVEQHRPWSWIAEPPIRYVVPHVLFWGVLFCFAMYPILGRPRKFKPKSINETEMDSSLNSSELQSLHAVNSMGSFRSHIVAMGKLYRRTENLEMAAEKVKSFQRSQISERPIKKEIE